MLNRNISVIIPAYNEEKNIVNTINETKRELESLNYSYEIIVVDDGSKDKTSETVENNFNFEKDKVRIEGYKPNYGKGNALKYGTGFAGGDYILFLDADLDLHPRQLGRFLDEMEKTGADAVIGSKKAKNSKVIYSFKRRFLSNGYYYFIKILFGLPVRDTQTGFKLFKSKALKESIRRILVKGYTFDLELLIILNKKGYKIVECPVQVVQSRPSSRIGQKDALSVFKDTIKIFYRLYFKKYYN
jgi:glycosyltransferase involved in cell wall biosynthesis